MKEQVVIRRAGLEDLDLVVEAILSAERSGTDKLGLATVFDRPEAEVRILVRSMLEEEVDGCELSLSGFLIAEVGGVGAAAVCGWVEAFRGSLPSGLLKANLIGRVYPGSALQALARNMDALSGVRIERSPGALQIEYVHVSPAFRGLGLAAKLIREHERAAADLEPAPVLAQVQVFSNNPVAIGLYLRSGFRTVRTHTSTHPDTGRLLPHHEKLLLEKALN